MLASSFRCRSFALTSARRSHTFGPRVYPRLHTVPSGFGWTPPFAIVETAPGIFATSIQPRSLAPATSATFYVDAAKANNTANGQSEANAEQAIWAGLNDVGVGTPAQLRIKGSAVPTAPTLYGYLKAWRVGVSANLDVRVLSDLSDPNSKGYAVSSTALQAGDGELGTWGIAGGDGPNVYAATLTTAPGRVVDAATQTTAGASVLTNRASIALVEANPGSWHHASGTLYVRTTDSRAPDTNLRPLRGGTSVNGHINTASTVYIERLSFEGGSARVLHVANGATVTLVDCTISRGTLAGLELNSAVGVTDATITAYFIRCRFLGNAGDGCGYTANGSGMTVNAVELDCEYVGNSGAGTDQGCSGHFTAGNTAIRIVRINPRCSSNKTQGFADVGTGSDGCKVLIYGGRIESEAVGYYCGDGTQAWLTGTVLTGNTTDIQTDDVTGVVNVSGTHYTTTSGTGTVQVYQP